jgi:diacylglycerol kinase (ATP)
MRTVAILGPGASPADLKPFQQFPATTWLHEFPASPAGADAVLIFGGDGTIHRHLAKLVELQIPVLIVPRGSGNDFARALGLRSWRDSLAAWREFVVQGRNPDRVDLGVVRPLDGPADAEPGSRFFCTVAGVGLDGEVARVANQLPRWLRGNGGYVLGLLAVLFRFHALPVKISELRGPAGTPPGLGSFQPMMLAAFANTPAYGGGMKIAPRAGLRDGTLDVCVVRALSKLKLLFLFPSVYSGRHLSVREVDYFSSHALQVETETPSSVYADGEYVCQTPVEIAVKPAALPVILPATG